MPLCIFHTNMGEDRVTDEFHAKLSKLLSEITGSSERSCTVELRTSKKMCRAAQPETDWGFFEIQVVGASENYDVNRERGAKVVSLAEAELGLPQKSCFIMMHNNNPIHIGLGNDKLVADMPRNQDYVDLQLYDGLRS